MQIAISKIRIDGGTQSRAGMSGPTVYEYADLMKEGVKFPDVVVFHDSLDYWLADGFHRVAAAIEAKLKTINADVRLGTRRDAVLYSTGANADHGLRRTNADKRRAIETLLRDEEWAAWSDREIARRCGVSAPTVSNVRAELKPTVKVLQSDVRRGGDGREINTAGINANRHWGLSNGMAFWSRVEQFGLDKETILEQLQSGAKVLTDLTLTKEYAWEKLDMLGMDVLVKRFPYDSFVFHPATKRVAQVKAYDTRTLEVYDHKRRQDDLWSVVGLRLATDDERTAYEKSEAPSHSFRVGDSVVIEGSEVVGSVTEIKNDTVRVTRPNPNGGSNMTHWVAAEKVSKAPPPAAPKWNVGDKVITRAGHEGVVVAASDAHIMVKTTNTTSSHKAETLTPAAPQSEPEQLIWGNGQPVTAEEQRQLEETAWQPAESVTAEQQRAAAALERLMVYTIGESPLYPDILKDVDTVSIWLETVSAWAEAELQPDRS